MSIDTDVLGGCDVGNGSGFLAYPYGGEGLVGLTYQRPKESGLSALNYAGECEARSAPSPGFTDGVESA